MNGRSNEEQELAREESGSWAPMSRTITRPSGGRPSFLRKTSLERPAGSPGGGFFSRLSQRGSAEAAPSPSYESAPQENAGPMSIETPVSMDETEESEAGFSNPFGAINMKSKMDAIKAEMIRRAKAGRPSSRPFWLQRPASTETRPSWFETIRKRQQANLIPQAQQSAMPVSWQNVIRPDRESWERRGTPPSYAPISAAYPSPFTVSAPSVSSPTSAYDDQIRSLMQQMGITGKTITSMQTGKIMSTLASPHAPAAVANYLANNGIAQVGANIQLSGCGFAAKRNRDGSVSVKARLAKSNERGDTADYSLVVPAAEAKKAMRFMLAWHKQQHAGSPADPTAPVAPSEPTIEVPEAPMLAEPEMAIVGAGLSVRKAYAKLRATPQAGRAGMLSKIINDLMPTPFKV